MSESVNLLQITKDARGVVTLTLNDPARFNALGSEMLAALQEALNGLAGDDTVRVVVLAGAGKAFCAGHNLKDMAAHPELAWYQQLFSQCSRMMLSLQQLPVPVIARVHGMATAAGCQLVAQCDLAVAAEGMEMLLTGDFIDAQTALREGLVNRVVPLEALDAEVERLVQSIVEKPRAAVALGKALVYRQRELGLEAAYQIAGQTMAVNMMDEAAQEGARAFAEKRKPGWKA